MHRACCKHSKPLAQLHAPGSATEQVRHSHCAAVTAKLDLQHHGLMVSACVSACTIQQSSAAAACDHSL